MYIIHGHDSSFLSFIPQLTPRFFAKDKQVFAYLVGPSGEPFSSYTSELGTLAIDFLYDPLFEQIVGFLGASAELVSKINNGIDVSAQWTCFEIFIRTLYNDRRMHPFYYPLFVNTANAFRLGMCDAAGAPLGEDYFVRQGEALVELKQRVLSLLDAQDAVEDLSAVVHCYHQAAFQSPLPITNLYAEFVSVHDESPEMVMVVLPQTPLEMWNYLLPAYAVAGMRFKRCENCRRFFATTGRGNPKFCERIIEGTDKSCRQLMPKLNFNSKAEKDPAIWLYNRAYKTMYSRVSTGAMKKDMFQEWARRARQQRDSCSRGEIPPETYSAWLCDNGLFIDYLKESK